MKKYTNKEIIKEVNKIENIIDKKNYLKDLYLVDVYDEKFDKTSNKFVRKDKEMYFIKKDDLKEEVETDLKFENKNENSIIKIKSLKVDFNMLNDINGNLEDLKNINTKVEITIDSEKIKKMEDFKKEISHFDGSFRIEKDREKLLINAVEKNGEHWSELEITSKTFNTFKELSFKESPKVEESLRKFNEFLFENPIDSKAYLYKKDILNLIEDNDCMILNIDGNDKSQNSLYIEKDDKKLSLKGEEVELEKNLIITGYTKNLFEMEQDKAEKYIVKPFEIEQDKKNVQDQILWRISNFRDMSREIVSEMFNDDDLIKKTNNFTENKEILKEEFADRTKNIYEGFGKEFKEELIKRKAFFLDFNIKVHNGEKKVKEIFEMGSPEEYLDNVQIYTRNLYEKEIKNFNDKIDKDDIRDVFDKKNFVFRDDNLSKKVEKLYDDLYKYVTWKEVEEHLGKANNKTYSNIAKGIGLEVSPFSDKFDKLEKKLSKENFEKNVEKHINVEKNIEKSIENEKDNGKDF